MELIKIDKKQFNRLYSIACSSWKTKFDDKFKNFIFSDYIEIDRKFLDEMKGACTTDQLPIFNEIFKDYQKKDLISRIKTYSDVCKELGQEELKMDNTRSTLSGNGTRKLLAFAKIKQLEELFNEGWIPDWRNLNERKWFPYFEYRSSGGFGFGSSVYCLSLALFGSSYYKTQEISDHIGTHFKEIYLDLLD